MPEQNGVPPAPVKFTTCMIVRNCAKELERCLKSWAAYTDELVIVNTGEHPNEKGYQETNAVAESFGAKVFHFPWIEDFAKARNFSFSKATHDIVMWLDSDDTVENPRDFAQAIRGLFGQRSFEVLYAEYLYDFDERGQCTSILTRERVVDRRYFEWRAPIHEVLCENFRCRGAMLPAHVARIRHNRLRGEEQTRGSLERNLRIIEHHYLPREQGGLGEYCEERMVFYWANTLTGLGKYEEAIKKYGEYIPRSGSNAEIQQALSAASECARMIEKYREAKALAFQAIERNPDAPTPWWMAAMAHYKTDNLDLAAHYALGCLERGGKIGNEMVANPKVVYGGAALLLANIRANQGRFDEVPALLDIAVKQYGEENDEVKKLREITVTAKRRQALVQSYLMLQRVAEAEGRVDDLRALAKAAPKEIAGLPQVGRYLFKQRPADKKTIIFLCGGGMVGGWGPELLETGIGGSEEAVCFLAEQFAKRGWHVEVYGPCKRQTWQGVEWYPHTEFSGDDDPHTADVLIAWRNAWQVVEFGAKAKRTYLWLHDMPDRGCWMADIWNSFDGIFVLSEFHKRVYEFVPDEKKILSANGIPLERLVPVDQLTNEPHRMIYASDPTRGLETVLQWWKHIRAAVQDAELDIYYGISSTLLAATRNPSPAGRHLAGIVQRVVELRDQPGVNWHGSVGQDELHKAMARSGLWLYPTVFPEIHCITACKMQAHGVIPVTVNDFALAETVRRGVKLDLKMDTLENQKVWADKVIELAKTPWTQAERIDMALDARAHFGWSYVADQWAGIFEASLAEPRGGKVWQRNRLDVALRP
jgi:glycosyltransferase involved in cell wall biosynthesis